MGTMNPAYRAELEHLRIEADRIVPHLYQGSRPPVGTALARAHFDTVVLCAEELTPKQPREDFPGVEVLYCPLDDQNSELRPGDARKALWTARMVASRVRRGARVLVTCQMGLNRSGFVNAMVLHFLSGRPGEECVRRVREMRPGALFNKGFVEALSAMG